MNVPQVCRGFYVAARASDIWRRVCIQTWVAGLPIEEPSLGQYFITSCPNQHFFFCFSPSLNTRSYNRRPLHSHLRMYAALKKQFCSKKDFFKNDEKRVKRFLLFNFLVWTLQCFQKILIFFDPKNMKKNHPQKLLIIGPQLFLCTGPADKRPRNRNPVPPKAP